MPDTSVAIIGAGIGGVYLAAELGRRGCRLRLHDIDDSRLSPIRERGGLDVEGSDAGFAAIERVTTDPAAAVEGADIIAVCTGGTYQEGVARGLGPLLRDGQTILLIQGNTGGSLVVRRALDAAGVRAQVDIAEIDNYPYSCRRLAPTRIRPIVRKKFLQIAAFPGSRSDAVFARLAPLFPHGIAAPNIIATGFTNANAMLHVANCLLNATRIEHGETYKFYADGVTPAVARIYEAINAERVAAATALGATVPTLADWFDRVYKVREATLVEAFQKLTYNADGPYGGTPAPKSFANNYIAEDVPVGLMPIAALGEAAGVAMTATRTLVDMTCLMTGETYAATARTLDRMGLAGRDGAGIRRVVEHGFA